MTSLIRGDTSLDGNLHVASLETSNSFERFCLISEMPLFTSPGVGINLGCNICSCSAEPRPGSTGFPPPPSQPRTHGRPPTHLRSCSEHRDSEEARHAAWTGHCHKVGSHQLVRQSCIQLSLYQPSGKCNLAHHILNWLLGARCP